MTKTSLFKLIPALGLCVLSTLAQALPSYQFTALAPAQDGAYSVARGINNLGQVVGATIQSDYSTRATLWSGGTAIDLGVLAGQASSYAQAINDSGLIVGDSSGGGSTHATLFQAGYAPRDLDPNGGYRSSYAMDINQHGHIVGYVADGGLELPPSHRATLWTELGPLNLDTTGYGSAAYAINNNGAIIGDAYRTTTSYGTASIWRGTSTPTSISPSGIFTTDINDAGDVVGYSVDLSAPGSIMRPVIWRGDQWIDLSSQPGKGIAHAINTFGQAVGIMNNRATLWAEGREIDLNTLLDPSAFNAGWQLLTAFDINEQGWIVGSAYNSITRERRGYLLSITTVPEPGTAAMVLIGMAMLVPLRARNRRQH